MTTEITLRQGEFAKTAERSKDAVRSGEAVGHAPYDRASLPGEKQKRYRPIDLVLVVVMDMFRAQGLANAEASEAARCGHDQVLKLLNESEVGSDSSSDVFVYHSFRVLMDPSGNKAGDTNVGCDKLEVISNRFVEWAQGVDLLKDELAVKSGFAWVHAGPKIAVVNLRTAFLHAERLAKLQGYLIKGDGFVPFASLQESDQ